MSTQTGIADLRVKCSATPARLHDSRRVAVIANIPAKPCEGLRDRKLVREVDYS